MTLADNQAGPERRYSWPRSILIGLAVAVAYFAVNALFGLVPGEVWFRIAGALVFGLVATVGWRFGWGNARWRSTRPRD